MQQPEWIEQVRRRPLPPPIGLNHGRTQLDPEWVAEMRRRGTRQYATAFILVIAGVALTAVLNLTLGPQAAILGALVLLAVGAPSGFILSEAFITFRTLREGLMWSEATNDACPYCLIKYGWMEGEPWLRFDTPLAWCCRVCGTEACGLDWMARLKNHPCTTHPAPRRNLNE